MARVTPVTMDWPARIPKPRVGLVRDRDRKPYWTKYERFLLNNGIPFTFCDIHRSDWQEQVRDVDVVVWRPCSEPAELAEARRKIFIMEEYLAKSCYPDSRTIMLYEDKNTQMEVMRALGIPTVPTFLSYDREEVLKAIPGLEYPLVSKIYAGAASKGVELVRDPRAARSLAERAFSAFGRQTYHPYETQKDYVYFQRFQENEGYDLRIIVCGKYVYGYYRYVPRGEFRASGMGLWRLKDIPDDALRLAVHTADRLDHIKLAVDMLRDPVDKKLYIIELSAFVRVLFPAALCVDGVSGVYVMDPGGGYHFEPRLFWLQELELETYLLKRWIHPRL